MADSHRTARVAERLREELARILREEVSDPRLSSIYVSKVDVTADLQLATIGIRLSPDPTRGEGAAELARRQALAGLKSASGRLRALLAQALKLRRAIELRFLYDEGVDAITQIEQILHEIAVEKKP